MPKQCPSCQQTLDDSASSCPICGGLVWSNACPKRRDGGARGELSQVGVRRGRSPSPAPMYDIG